MELYQTMPRMGVKPDNSVYRVLIETFGSRGLTQEVLNLLQDMKQNNVKPDLMVKQMIIYALTDSNDPEARKALDEAKEYGAMPYTHILWSEHFARQQMPEVLQVLNKMVQDELPDPTLILRTLYYLMGKKDYSNIVALVDIITSSKVAIGKDFVALKIIRALDKNGYRTLAARMESWARTVSDFNRDGDYNSEWWWLNDG
jgi:pentatricopeptide repeat protein